MSQIYENASYLYGANECLTNSIIDILIQNNISVDGIYKYNYNLFFLENEDFLGGCLLRSEIAIMMSEIYGISVINSDFNDLRNGKNYIIGLNGHDLPFLDFFYKKRNQIHYSIATVNGNYLNILDPYYKRKISMTINDAYDSWKYYNRPIMSFAFDKLKVIKPLEEIIPYFASFQNVKNYMDTIEKLKIAIIKFIDIDQADYRFKIFYSSLYCMLINRQKHFGILNSQSEHKNNVLSSWANLLKRFIRLYHEKKIEEILQVIDELAKNECSYIIEYQQKSETIISR